MNATLESLYVPEPVASQLSSHLADAKSLHDWLIGLPQVQPLDLGRTLYDALFTLNRSKLDRDFRLQALEQFQTKIDIHLPALERLYHGVAVPQRERAEQAWHLARDLLLELICACKLVLREESSRRFVFGQRNAAGLLLRLLQLSQRVLMLCYGNYYPVPERVWLEVHLLFRHAWEQKMLDEVPEGASVSIQQLYKQILLLGLSDPHSLLPGEIQKVQEWLHKLANYATLQAVSQLADPAGFFLIQLDRDVPPQFMGHRPMQLDGRHAILLNTFEVVRRLHKELVPLEKVAASSSHFQKATHHIDLLRRLIRAWGITPQRLFNRMRNNASVLLVSGLWSAHQQLQRERLQAEDVGALELEPAAVAAEEPVAETGGEVVRVVPPVSPEVHLSRWQVINVSPGGYALQLETAQPESITVGSVVLIRSEHVDRWNVAVVRWVRQGRLLDIGLQLLAPFAEAVRVRRKENDQVEHYEPALLLPSVPEMKQPASLIAPAGQFAPLREFDVMRMTDEVSIRAIRRMDHGMNVDQFEFITPAQLEALLEMPAAQASSF